MGPSLIAGLRLGGYAFAVGVLLGLVREAALAPWLGGLAAALVEAALLMVVLWPLAGWALQPRPAQPWAAGLGAVSAVLGMETGLGLLFTALGPAVQRVPRDLLEQAVGVMPLAWLGLLPWLRRSA